MTRNESEATLEARMNAVIGAIFPWNIKLEHQTRFAFQIGHRKFEVDGEEVSRIEGRTDILVSRSDDVPVAIVELKRAGLPLTRDDVEQGLSYARLFQARPPLVVVTNGTETQVYNSLTGEEIAGTTFDEQRFAQLVAAAGKVATEHIKQAIETLLGPGSAVWAAAVDKATGDVIQQETGSWKEWYKPFVDGFLIPRAATKRICEHVSKGARLTVLHGAPLSGRSNVLRELVAEMDQRQVSCLLIANEGASVFQRLADALATHLDWRITSDEARDWLRGLSLSATDRRLVLLIDDVSRDTQAVKDMLDIVGAGFGGRVSIVATLTTSAWDELRFSADGVSRSAIGKSAVPEALLPLSDEEFEAAKACLWQHSVSLMTGAAFSSEYRLPWFIRAMLGQWESLPDPDSETCFELPSMATAELIVHTRTRFHDHVPLRSAMQRLARAILEEANHCIDGAPVLTDSADMFEVSRDIAVAHLKEAGLRDLLRRGVIKEQIVSDGSVLVVTLPELAASELAFCIAPELSSRATRDFEAALSWYVSLTVLLPFGDIICARALLDAWVMDPAAEVTQKLYEHIVNLARFAEPTISTTQEKMDVEHAVFPLLASRLVEVPAEFDGEHGPQDARPAILFDLTKVRVPLLRGGGSRKLLTYRFADTVVLSPQYGVIESITLALFNWFQVADPALRDSWISDVAREGSIAQLYRTMTAISQMQELESEVHRQWADAAIQEKIDPALSKQIGLLGVGRP
ncbi:type I restriction enzyme HsdR N-terminal domain-containing protein [Burkholderia gladioli]|uniref:type I restriction enzyme HsdR N-terminal domain-containing protein n=1 Tax=Burkholderia gladioli TaxID=28095 RepID=UPI00202F5530|nr:type I restriction enzyme HsdR N-terminal domain-containing protein [Burkholderia gladioli]URV26996.1 type I restriction enzyme HsdR N-terminal domain-containing protein [Burkholderia gladioli]